jgi:flagellar protein FlaF
MQHALYAEIQDDSGGTARNREREAIERSIGLLEKARTAGPLSRDAIDALHYLDRLWSLLLEDLAHAENQLPRELRASLISIGIWILREVEQIRSQRSSNFGGLIDVSQMISNGLGGRA